MNRFGRIFPFLIVLPALAFVIARLYIPADPAGGFHLNAFARIPVVYEGRIQPIDTLARNSLRVISNKQSAYDPVASTKIPASLWLLEVMSQSPRALALPVFRIDNLDLLSSLSLKPRTEPKALAFRYAPDEFQQAFRELAPQIQAAMQLDSDQRDLYQARLVRLTAASNLFVSLYQRTIPYFIPPASSTDTWHDLSESAARFQQTGKADPAAATFINLLAAYAENDPSLFNTTLDHHLDIVHQALSASDLARVNFEYDFNHYQPFLICAGLYLVAFLLSALAWLVCPKPLNRAAFLLLILTLIVHALALAARIYISGRPPVTNLYSSAVFIGFGCVLLGLIFESIFKLGVGNTVAAVAGFTTLVIAHSLAGDGDTFKLLQAVLDTNFWLATHVVCITLGYSTTFLAGLLGIIYIFRGLFTNSLTPSVQRDISRMIYGSLCFALFFSFVGTILGGLWADDSWGRFWGWDPKENGALIIVLWNALILHARWGGIFRSRGIAVAAVFGNIVTAWSWFGVNQLSVGLHSYGFTDSAARNLTLFVLSQCIIIAFGLFPLKLWRSPLNRASLNTSSS